MNHQERIQWFGENVDFFTSLRSKDLALPVPTCPPWTILDLCQHLSFGLGVCYPIAAATAPDTPDESAFADADRSCVTLGKRKAVRAFRTNMTNCRDALASMNPDSPCWTYAGPGTVSFWIRRAVSETTVHRFDAERALGHVGTLSPDRGDDGIGEAFDFALPFAGQKIGVPASVLHIESTDSELRCSIGSGAQEVRLIGDSYSLLLKLWGREPHRPVRVEGDKGGATEWLTLIHRAFAGR